MEAARGDQDQVRLRRGHRGPARLDRPLPWLARHRFSARRGDQVGHPVARGERRVGPFDDGDPGPGPPGDPFRDAGEPATELADQADGAAGCAGPLADGQDRLQDFCQGTGIKRQHVRLAAEVAKCLADMPGRQGAYPAQILRQDQVRRQPGERPRVQGVQVLAGRELRTDVLVDLARRHSRRIPAADHDRLLRPRRRRLIAVERDPGQVIAQAEGVHDLGRGRQQRHQAHQPSIGEPGGTGRGQPAQPRGPRNARAGGNQYP